MTTKLFNVGYMELCVFKIGEDIKHLNDFVVSTKFELDRFRNISVHFKGANTVNHILEFRLTSSFNY